MDHVAADALLLYAELPPAGVRTVQRRLRNKTLRRIAPGIATSLPKREWPDLITRERTRVLAALFPRAVMGPHSAFLGGVPDRGVIFLTWTSTRTVRLPGLTIRATKGAAPAPGDLPMMGRELYYPSFTRLVLENLRASRGEHRRTAGAAAVEQRLIDVCDARGEEALHSLREDARQRATELGCMREFALLDSLVGTILGTRKARMKTRAGKARSAALPYDEKRIALFEALAAPLRSMALHQPAAPVRSERGRAHFAFLESYFSNFIEGTEFGVEEARAFILEGQPIRQRPKDSHDIVGVFHQAFDRAWINQTLAPGEPALRQICDRHAHMMRERPEVGPDEFKTVANRAGNTEFVAPRLVRGTLAEGSRILASVPAGSARAILAMFIVAEVHPFTDGNGRLARLVMNAELSTVNACRIIVPTLYREEYLDCLRALSRQGDPAPLIEALQKIHVWTAAFDYESIDDTIEAMRACNAFERSRIQFKLFMPPGR